MLLVGVHAATTEGTSAPSLAASLFVERVLLHLERHEHGTVLVAIANVVVHAFGSAT